MKNKKIHVTPGETLNEVKVMIMAVGSWKSWEEKYMSYKMRSLTRETSKGKST